MPVSYWIRTDFFWGELIDKYITINTNSKTVFSDYAMLKLVFIVPICFHYSVNHCVTSLIIYLAVGEVIFSCHH